MVLLQFFKDALLTEGIAQRPRRKHAQHPNDDCSIPTRTKSVHYPWKTAIRVFIGNFHDQLWIVLENIDLTFFSLSHTAGNRLLQICSHHQNIVYGLGDDAAGSSG